MEIEEYKNKKHLLLLMGEVSKMRILLFDPAKSLNKEEISEIIDNIIFVKNKIKSFFDRTKEKLGILEDIEFVRGDNTIENLSIGHALLSNLVIVTTQHLISGKDIDGYNKNELIQEFKVGYALYFGSLEVS